MPLGLPHSTSEQIEINGYTIPAGDIVMANIYWIHREPSLWSQPEEFLPERWLNSDNKIVKPKHYIPFSVGKFNVDRKRLVILNLTQIYSYQLDLAYDR